MTAPGPTYCACGDHAFAPLTRGYMVMVSPEDALLLHLSMHARVCNTGFAYAALPPERENGGYLHRLLMRAAKGQVVDHINRDKMDNRRENLRLCTHAENMQNRRATRKGHDLPKGVTKDANRYRAQIGKDGRKFNLGTYETPEEAQAVYMAKAIELFGQFARAA